MLNILRDPAWQGIAGIVAIIALVLYILVESGRFPKWIPALRIKLLQLILPIGFYILISFLTISAEATIFTIVTGLGLPWGIFLAVLLLGLGLANFFAFTSYLLLQNYVRNINFYILALAGTIMFNSVAEAFWEGLIRGDINLTSIASRIFEWGTGMFMMGMGITAVLFFEKHFLDAQKRR